MIKVRIDKCKNSNYWYNGIVGSTFSVSEDGDNFLLFGVKTLAINKSDCTKIADDLTKTVKHVQPTGQKRPKPEDFIIKGNINCPEPERLINCEGSAGVYYDGTAYRLAVMQFEKCSAPVEEIKDTDLHSQKLEHFQVASTLVGFKFKDKDLDMLVSMYDLVNEFGGKLDLDTITTKEFEVNERHLVKPVE